MRGLVEFHLQQEAPKRDTDLGDGHNRLDILIDRLEYLFGRFLEGCRECISAVWDLVIPKNLLRRWHAQRLKRRQDQGDDLEPHGVARFIEAIEGYAFVVTGAIKAIATPIWQMLKVVARLIFPQWLRQYFRFLTYPLQSAMVFTVAWRASRNYRKLIWSVV